MALKIYPDEGISSAYSQDGVMTNPFRQAFDGKTGTTRESLLYLGNDNSGYTYSSVTLRAITVAGRDIVNGDDGYGIKLSSGATQPTADGWRAVDYGNILSMGNISNTPIPFWVRIEVPKGAPVESFEDTVFRVAATETVVP